MKIPRRIAFVRLNQVGHFLNDAVDSFIGEVLSIRTSPPSENFNERPSDFFILLPGAPTIVIEPV
ncbi:MAG TPA: hypothetical protein VJU86_14065 [Pyrinomonadaceae bacterium]|nr:hypothetical protein [Pyrinomonadaceae bacterium]